jgi:hypothetical protein
MAGAQQGFGVAGAVLELEPYQHRTLSFFESVGNGESVSTRKSKRSSHCAAEFEKLAARDTTVREGFGKQAFGGHQATSGRLHAFLQGCCPQLSFSFTRGRLKQDVMQITFHELETGAYGGAALR